MGSMQLLILRSETDRDLKRDRTDHHPTELSNT
jgi:hypothetical protein